MSVDDANKATNQAKYYWLTAFETAMKFVGAGEDISKMTFEEKKRIDIFQSVLFKAMNENRNSIRLANALAGLKKGETK